MPKDRLPPLRDVMQRHGLQPKKSLGQNFLLDLNITAKVARVAHPLPTGSVVEIGPGPGGLTRALLSEGAAHVVAIEKDQRCLAALEEVSQAYPGQLTLIEADALSVDINTIAPAPRAIVANLPYNIATPLLMGWLQAIANNPAFVETMVLMFQKEVADRLLAEPHTKAYGRLSVITQWLCEVRPCFDLPPSVFTPPPKVTSSVVAITPRAEPQFEASFAALEKLTAVLFQQRRKMLRQSLKSLAPNATDRLEQAGIDPTVRAETLSVAEIGRLLAAFR